MLGKSELLSLVVKSMLLAVIDLVLFPYLLVYICLCGCLIDVGRPPSEFKVLGFDIKLRISWRKTVEGEIFGKMG